MSFQGKYEILSALNDGESQSFRALQISSGRPVLVHHLVAGRSPSGQADLASLIFKFLRTASTEEGRHLLDMGEDEGRVFVVTADVPECQDLRTWLLAVTEAHSEQGVDDPPAGSEMPDSGNLDFTRTFTTEALRQVSRLSASLPVSASQAPSAVPKAVPAPEKSPGIPVPPAVLPAAPAGSAGDGMIDFAGFWEKSSPVNLPGSPASKPPPIPSPFGLEDSSEVPEVTAEYLSRRSAQDLHNAPTAAFPSLRAKVAESDRAPAVKAAPAEVKEVAGLPGGQVMQPQDVARPPASPSASETPPVPASPDAVGGETMAPKAIADLLREYSIAPLPVRAPTPTPNSGDKPEGEIKADEKAPRRQIPMGFEVVFQSSKPRTRPTGSGAGDRSGIMTAPSFMGSQAPEQPGPAPTNAAPPNIPPSAVAPAAEKVVGGTGVDFISARADRRAASALGDQPTDPPSPSLAQQARNQSNQETLLVSAPPALPARLVPPPRPDDPIAAVGAPPAPVRVQPTPNESNQATRVVSSPPLPPTRPAPPAAPMASARGSWPPPPARVQPNANESGQATRVVLSPPMPPTRPAPPPPPIASTGGGAPPSTPAMSNRAQPGEYTRMIENVRAFAGPLPPVDAPVAPAAIYRPGQEFRGCGS